jgi:hypothetical protein
MIKILNKIFFLFFLFFTIRLALIFFYPADHELKYIVVAENILSGCGVSYSPPNTNDCIPAFGPNGPGYPFFLALLKFIFDNDIFIKVVQIVIYFFSILFVKEQIFRFTNSFKISNITFIVLSISPLTLAWSRHILTETLMISLSLIFIGFVIKSLNAKKFYSLEICLIFIIMTFIRADSIFFIVPIVYLTFNIHGFEQGLKKVIIFSLIFSIPWIFWTYRNFSNGVSIYPNNSESYETIIKKNFPIGYFKWVNSWTIDQYAVIKATSPIFNDLKKLDYRFKYENIIIDNNIYFSSEEKKKTEELLGDLKLYSGKPFPASIDSQFEYLANLRKTENKIFSYFIKPTKRLINLWFNPYYSHGWPIEVEKKLYDLKVDYQNKNFIEKFFVIKILPIEITLKIILFTWSFLLYLLIVSSFFIKKNQNTELLFKACLYLILIKSLFFIYTGYFETRYISNLIPLIEVLIILVFGKMISDLKDNNKLIKQYLK